jgi:hypothetical protein
MPLSGIATGFVELSTDALLLLYSPDFSFGSGAGCLADRIGMIRLISHVDAVRIAGLPAFSLANRVIFGHRQGHERNDRAENQQWFHTHLQV